MGVGFVRDIGAEGKSEAIVKAIIALAHNLGKRVTAEGVESERQLDFLRHHGRDEVEGFLLAHPGPAGEIDTIFRALTDEVNWKNTD